MDERIRFAVPLQQRRYLCVLGRNLRFKKFRNQISRGIRQDIAIGIEQGRFDVKLTDLLLTSLLAIVAMALREILEQSKATHFEQAAAEMILRVLGVPPKEARARYRVV